MDASLTSEPVSDLVVAAKYADAELHSVATQLASSASMKEAPETSMVDVVIDDSDSDSSGDETFVKQQTRESIELTAEAEESSSSEEDEDPLKLRMQIEAAMMKKDNKISGPLTTEHEVVTAPVREPSVELTEGCPIVQCGSILNVNVPSLMMTVKSNSNSKPLDEGSVLCLEDRTVIGCVDEIFGPVLMPMYLVRFVNASKMPEKATVNVAVYSVREHTTYIIPENIKDKGTDASDLFDEETDETEFSDDEAEAAWKWGNRKRNRGGTQSIAGDNASIVSSYNGRGGRGGRSDRGGRGSGRGSGSGNFNDYHARQNTLLRGGRSSYGQQPPMPAIPGISIPTIPALQTRPYGGVTKYTQPGGFVGARSPVVSGNTKYTSLRGNVVSPPMPAIYGVGMTQPQQIPLHGYYQPPPSQYMPPYPLQVPYQPSTAAYLQLQQASTPYGQPQPPRPPPPPPANYGVNSQQPPPGQPYDQSRYK